MDLSEFYYPEDYFDFSNGIPVSETSVNMFIQQAIEDGIKEKIKKHPDRDEYFHSIGTGNTKVIVECYRQHNDSKLFTVYISVATAYKQRIKMDVDLS